MPPFVGLGRDRRILIGDTLLDLCSHDEIEAVFAHELGHMALHHNGKLLGIQRSGRWWASTCSTSCSDAARRRWASPARRTSPHWPLSLLWLMLFGLVVQPLHAAAHATFERQADLFIVGRVAEPQTLVSALR